MGHFPHTEWAAWGGWRCDFNLSWANWIPWPPYQENYLSFFFNTKFIIKKKQKKTLFQCFFRRSCFFRHKKQFFSKKTKVFFSNCITSVDYAYLLQFYSILRRDHQKNFLWASHQRVGRRKEPILGYVQKMMKKKFGP